jgi:hypothetical protein
VVFNSPPSSFLNTLFHAPSFRLHTEGRKHFAAIPVPARANRSLFPQMCHALSMPSTYIITSRADPLIGACSPSNFFSVQSLSVQGMEKNKIDILTRP